MKVGECVLMTLNLEPNDFLGNIFAKVIGTLLQDDAKRRQIEKWEMRVVIETNFYPISLVFANGLRIERGRLKSPTLTLLTSMDTIVDIARGEISPMSAILKRHIKVKGLFRHPVATLRLYRLLNEALGGA